MKKKIIKTAVCALFLTLPVTAQEEISKNGSLPEVVVEGDMVEKLIKMGQLKNSIIKTCSVTESSIESKHALNLAEAIKNEPGVDSVVGCSICGMKRVQINGLKGEHTTVLIDGVPLNSTVSSFYGFDAMTTAGIAEVEIARGAGSALIAPESIGGVINVLFKRPKENSLLLNTSYGSHENMISIFATGISKDKKRSVIASAQHNKQISMDSDDNGVNESPNMRNNSALLKYSYQAGEDDNIDMRLSVLDSQVYGGSLNRWIFYTSAASGPGLVFKDGDVRKKYEGDPKDVSEIIGTRRSEGVIKWTHRAKENLNTVATFGGAIQKQDSFYEGADYAHRDNTGFGEIQTNWKISDKHLLTAGISRKREILHSHSYTYFVAAGRKKDDFDYGQTGYYLQDVFKPSEKAELSMAIRADDIKLNFTDQTIKENEVNETVFSPRLHLRVNHGGGFTSMISYGNGYRAPLTFFESEHGLLDNGFQTLVTKIERSNSVGYTLAYESDRLTANTSISWAKIKNMAYVDSDNYTIPTLVNDNGSSEVGNFDVLAGYQLGKYFSVSSSYELFNYQDRYKRLLGFAAVEDRVRLLLGYDDDEKGWSADLDATWIGSRDLKPYGYGDRYNVYDGTTLSDPKSTHAPSYYTMNFRLSKKLKEDFILYSGVKNILDYTQTDDETPLFYDSNGGFDVGHLWGPLRGREIYFGASLKF